MRGVESRSGVERRSPEWNRIWVLNIVTNDSTPFFTRQVDRLEALGVASETMSVPGVNNNFAQGDGDRTRSVADYVRFVPSVVRESFGEYDLLHANYGLTAPAAIAQPNLPVVLSLWGSDLMGEYGILARHCANYVEEVIVMSERMAAELDRDCHVIPHGVDLDLFRPEPRREARDRLGWDHDTGYVLFPYPDNRDVKDYPRAKRVFEGARARTEGRVEFHALSGVPHEKVPTYMNAADVLLLTSKREGSPNTVKEAMACNLPVVATDVGDVPKRLAGVTHSTYGSTDGELIAGVATALEAGERSNGREHARDLSLDRMAERIRGVYEQALRA